MSGGRSARESADEASGGPAVALVKGDRLTTFGLRRMVVPFADRVRVVDRLAVADLVLVDPQLASDEIDVADLADRSAGGIVIYTWGPRWERSAHFVSGPPGGRCAAGCRRGSPPKTSCRPSNGSIAASGSASTLRRQRRIFKGWRHLW